MQDDNFIKVEKDTKVVACPVADSSSLHPKVYLKFGDSNKVKCYYCSNIFVKS